MSRKRQAEVEAEMEDTLVQEVPSIPEDTFADPNTPIGEEEIFNGGPTYNDLEQWKSQYNGEIYMTEFEDDEVFIWRPIRRKEYKDIAKIPQADQFYKEERVVSTCLLFPKSFSAANMSFGKAGIPTLLNELILEKSGFVARTGSMKL
jgi:hypothetical protein